MSKSSKGNLPLLQAITTTGMSAVIVVASVYAAVWLGTLIAVGLPLAIMLALILIGYIYCTKDNQAVNSLAERAHYFGFLATIASFSAAALQISLDTSLLQNGAEIARVLGIALTTTLLGLVLMDLLKGYASRLAPAEIDQAKFSNAVEQVAETLKSVQIPDAIAQSIERLQLLLDGFEKLHLSVAKANNAVSNLAKDQDRVAEAVSIFEKRLLGSSSGADVFRRSVQEMKGVLDDYVELVSQRLMP